MWKIVGSTAAALVVTIAAFAQTDSRAPSSQPAQSQSSQAPSQAQNSNAADTMTLVGCVIKESDYRRAHGLGKGALGGAGLGDEFVLVDTEPAGAATTTPSSKAVAPSTTASCTEKGTGPAYRLTGKRERELKSLVGRRLEITGSFDHPRDARTAAGQTHAKLPAEILIASYREEPASTTEAPTATTGVAAPAPAQTPPAAGTPPPETTPRKMPKTASDEPLIALIALLSLSGGFGLRLLRRRAS